MDPRPLSFLCAAAASLLCAGCADPHPPPILEYCSYLGGLIFSAQVAGIRALWCLWASRGGGPGRSLALRGRLLYAKDTRTRVRHACHMILQTSGAYILCRGCGDSSLASCWFLLGLLSWLLALMWWCISCTSRGDLCPQTLYRNTCPRTVAI